MTTWKFVSKPRLVLSFILSTAFVFYAFTFVPRNIQILTQRTIERQIADYLFNVVLFFIVIYLIASLFVFLFRRLYNT